MRRAAAAERRAAAAERRAAAAKRRAAAVEHHDSLAGAKSLIHVWTINCKHSKDDVPMYNIQLMTIVLTIVSQED